MDERETDEAALCRGAARSIFAALRTEKVLGGGGRKARIERKKLRDLARAWLQLAEDIEAQRAEAHRIVYGDPTKPKPLGILTHPSLKANP